MNTAPKLPKLPPVDGYDKRVDGHYSAETLQAYATQAIAEHITALAPPSGEGVDTGDLVNDPLYKALDALYSRGFDDSVKHKYDARGTKEWQAVLDLFRVYTTPQSAPVGGEFVMVPREPTDAMMEAALRLQGDDAFASKAPPLLSALLKIYRAMIAAVPAAVDGDLCLHDLAKANTQIVDEIREIVGLKGKPGSVIERVRELATPPPASQERGGVDEFLADVRAELIRARAKFPGDRIMTIALAEEFGELCKAILDEPAANVRKEAVQTAVMAARVVLDGDGSVNEWRKERGLDELIKGEE